METNKPVLYIEGKHILNGDVQIEGAKNSALPSLVAASLTNETVLLRNVPLNLNDIKIMLELLKSLGVIVECNYEDQTVRISTSNFKVNKVDGNLAGDIRHSLLLLGLSVAWENDIIIPFPSGCKLGTRKHDMHIDALTKLGNTVIEGNGISLEYAEAQDFTEIEFYYPTFGGTLNVIFASVKQVGKKVLIKNAAKNPEVMDVINLLTKMGASIHWVNDKELLIEGVAILNGVDYSIMPDRIVGATVIVATAITKGTVKLLNFSEQLLTTEISIWRDCGLKIQQDKNDLIIDGNNLEIIPKNITTKAYPGFHTDIQPLHTVLMCFASGSSIIKETILDGRFKYCEELNKMGANIKVSEGDFLAVNGKQGQIAEVNGPVKFRGTDVIATDIRGGAAVAIAALSGDGITKISNLYQLERGYGNFVELFSSLGAKLERVPEE